MRIYISPALRDRVSSNEVREEALEQAHEGDAFIRGRLVGASLTEVPGYVPLLARAGSAMALLRIRFGGDRGDRVFPFIVGPESVARPAYEPFPLPYRPMPRMRETHLVPAVVRPQPLGFPL